MNSHEIAIADTILSEIIKRLVEAYEPLCIYLFGSKARGEAGSDSDYDLLVLVPDNASPDRRRSRLAYERLWGTGGHRLPCPAVGGKNDQSLSYLA